MAKKRKSPKGIKLGRIGKAIVPGARKFDARTLEGRRYRQYCTDLALATEGSETPLMRSRIAAAAAALVYAEHLSWRIDQLSNLSTTQLIAYGEELRKATEAAHRAEQRLQGKYLHVGRPRDDGSPASDTGPRARSLGKRLSANGINGKGLN